MTRRTSYITAIAAVAFCLLVAPASANHVQCGDTITTYTVLDSDVVCPSGYQEFGLLIGADDVVLRLDNHTIDGGAGGGRYGISSSPGVSGVRIKRGTIQGFDDGVDMAANDSIVFKLNISTSIVIGSDGVRLIGDRNSVIQSTVNVTGSGGTVGIYMTGDDAYAWGNVVTGSLQIGVGTFGDRSGVVYNQVTCSSIGGGGVNVQGYETNAVVNRNTVSNCSTGIFVSDSGASGAARVALNQTTGGVVGMTVDDGEASVNRNTARNATAYGIHSLAPGTVVRGNGAYDNGDYGIYGEDGTVDGGGNTASGNRGGANPQCFNVQCGTP